MKDSNQDNKLLRPFKEYIGQMVLEIMIYYGNELACVKNRLDKNL